MSEFISVVKQLWIGGVTPEASLCDNYESSLPQEFIFVDDASSTDVEEAFDPPLSSLPLLSISTLIDTTISGLTLLASLLPLAQCTVIQMSKPPYRGDASIFWK